jgi:hypothetical protein
MKYLLRQTEVEMEVVSARKSNHSSRIGTMVTRIELGLIGIGVKYLFLQFVCFHPTFWVLKVCGVTSFAVFFYCTTRQI